MVKSAEMAPRNTVSRECCMDMMAAMKNVLSPISETMMTEREAMKPWVKLTSIPPPSDGFSVDPDALGAIAACGGQTGSAVSLSGVIRGHQ